MSSIDSDDEIITPEKKTLARPTRSNSKIKPAKPSRKKSRIVVDSSDDEEEEDDFIVGDNSSVDSEAEYREGSDDDGDGKKKKRKKKPAAKKKTETPVRKRKAEVKEEKQEEEDSDSDEEIQPPKKRGKTSASIKAKVEVDDKEEDDDDEEIVSPKSQRARTKGKAKLTIAKKETKKEPKKEPKKKTKEEEKEEENDVYKWWREETLEEIENKKFNKKWTTLKHNGVLFPPEYEPHGVKVLYNGKPVKLKPEEEEVATMFAVMRETDYYSNPTFRKNFWESFKEILGKGHVIKKLDKIDFTPIWKWHLEEKEKKKAMTKEEKKKIKEEKDKLEESYKYAWIDGMKESVGNFRIEPPGLFRGRGEHPRMGKLKKRVKPEDVIINIGKKKDAPKPPTGHKWKDVISDPQVSWIAMWRENVLGGGKYVNFAADSSIKGRADFIKFETARKVSKIIDGVRKQYKKDWNSSDITVQQRGVALYFIDRLALRAGHEKDEDVADTVGCCSLRVEHVKPKKSNRIEFDFLGKDSIRYLNVVEVEPAVHKLVKQFQMDKKESDNLFNKLTTSGLNTHLKTIMDKLTAKVFRTFNASLTLDQQLKMKEDSLKESTIAEKLAYYNTANREVAILCNHQRTVPKTFQSQVDRMDERIEEVEEYIANLKKAKKDLAKKDYDVVKKAWVERYEKKKTAFEKALKEYEEKVEQQEQQKRKKSLEAGSSSSSKKGKKKQESNGASEEAEVLVKPFKPPSRALPRSSEAIDNAIAKAEERNKTYETQKKMKMDNKTVALGTSKINYCDPRITVSWCKRNDVPLNKIFNKSLLKKFPWATDVDEDFSF